MSLWRVELVTAAGARVPLHLRAHQHDSGEVMHFEDRMTLGEFESALAEEEHVERLFASHIDARTGLAKPLLVLSSASEFVAVRIIGQDCFDPDEHAASIDLCVTRIDALKLPGGDMLMSPPAPPAVCHVQMRTRPGSRVSDIDVWSVHVDVFPQRLQYNTRAGAMLSGLRASYMIASQIESLLQPEIGDSCDPPAPRTKPGTPITFVTDSWKKFIGRWRKGRCKPTVPPAEQARDDTTVPPLPELADAAAPAPPPSDVITACLADDAAPARIKRVQDAHITRMLCDAYALDNPGRSFLRTPAGARYLRAIASPLDVLNGGHSAAIGVWARQVATEAHAPVRGARLQRVGDDASATAPVAEEKTPEEVAAEELADEPEQQSKAAAAKVKTGFLSNFREKMSGYWMAVRPSRATLSKLWKGTKAAGRVTGQTALKVLKSDTARSLADEITKRPEERKNLKDMSSALAQAYADQEAGGNKAIIGELAKEAVELAPQAISALKELMIKFEFVEKTGAAVSKWAAATVKAIPWNQVGPAAARVFSIIAGAARAL